MLLLGIITFILGVMLRDGDPDWFGENTASIGQFSFVLGTVLLAVWLFFLVWTIWVASQR